MEDISAESSVGVLTDASIVTISEHHSTDDSEQSQFTILLARLHAGYFIITLSFASQALLWKLLSEPTNHCQALESVSHIVSSTAFLLLWYISLITLVLLCTLYLMRCFFHFCMVKTVFLHHIGVNFFYIPWISWLILLQSAPLDVPRAFEALWCSFVIPILVLDVKVYGQWFTTERKLLSLLANPASQLSLIGNLVGARTAAQVGWKEGAICLFSIGMVHYIVLFVTLYQRLSGADRFPAMLRPAFFLFFATPSMASLAWESIMETFDTTSKILFFLSFFLFTSLASRPAFFKKSTRIFNVALWGYSFPLTLMALASLEYAREIRGCIAQGLMLSLSALSVLVFLGLILLTALNTNRLLQETDPILKFLYNSRALAVS